MSVQRILHIVGKMDRAGAETMLMNLYRHVDRNKVQFDFVTFTNEIGDYDAEIVSLGGRIIPIIASNSIKRMLCLQGFLKKNPEYKIVHAHMLLNNAFHLLAAKGAGVQHRISHSHNTSNGKNGTIKKIYEKWALITNRKVATHRIACGKEAAEYLFGNTKDVWLLPNAVDIKKMIEVADKSRNYTNQQFNNTGLKIIQVGRLNEVKNHRFSLRIAEDLKKYDIDFTLYIIGQGPLDSELKQKVRVRNLANHIKFLGMRTDITELMASADYMLMPSFHEGFPVVLVESQTVGLKTLVSDQISVEVDLGLGLIQFLPIDSASDWSEYLLKPRQSQPKEKEIISALNSYGFNAVKNAQELVGFYFQLLNFK